MSQSKARTARKTTLRDQLALKRARIVTEHFPLGEEGEKAAEAALKARQRLETMRLLAPSRNGVDLAKIEAETGEAEAERDRSCLILRLRGLTEDERDALASEYVFDDVPKNAERADRDRILADNDRKIKEWTYAALAVCVLESDLTVDEWRAELGSGRWTAGDVVRLREAIQRAYGSQPADGIPKG